MVARTTLVGLQEIRPQDPTIDLADIALPGVLEPHIERLLARDVRRERIRFARDHDLTENRPDLIEVLGPRHSNIHSLLSCCLSTPPHPVGSTSAILCEKVQTYPAKSRAEYCRSP